MLSIIGYTALLIGGAIVLNEVGAWLGLVEPGHDEHGDSSAPN